MATQVKGLSYYMGLPYTYQVRPAVNADGPYWAARVAEVPFVSGGGETPAEALESIRTSLEVWIEDALEGGTSVPEPAPDDAFSGQFRLRVSKALHRDLSIRAEQEGVSLNTWCATVLAQHGT